MVSFTEGMKKNYVIKGFYRNFLILKGKFHHQPQITLKFGQHKKRKEKKRKEKKNIFRIEKI